MDTISLALIVIPILVLSVFAEASLSKLIAREVPEWFRDQFAKTWLGKLPIAPMYWSIAVLELGVAVLAVISLATLEFNSMETLFLELSLLLATLVFAMLGVGLRVSMDFAGSANAFFYGALCVALWFIVVNVSALQLAFG